MKVVLLGDLELQPEGDVIFTAGAEEVRFRSFISLSDGAARLETWHVEDVDGFAFSWRDN